MATLQTRILSTLAALCIVFGLALPAYAQTLSSSDLSFAFGGAGPTAVAPSVPSAPTSTVATAARHMTPAEMRETEGAWIQIPIMIGRVAITGFTRHGLNQAINRGIGPRAIASTLRNPTQTRIYTSGPNANTTRYVGQQSTVVVNSQGRIVTVWGRGR